jgi:hypothetical protein
MKEDADKKELTLIDKIRLFEGHLGGNGRDFVLYLPLWIIDVITESKCGFPAYSRLHANMLRRICIKVRGFDPDEYRGGISVKNILKHLGDDNNTYNPDEKELGEWIETNYDWSTHYIITTARDKKLKEYEEEEVFRFAFDRFYLIVAEYFLDALDKSDPYKEVSRNG